MAMLMCDLFLVLKNSLLNGSKILWDFYENHFQAYISKLKAIILMN